MAPASSPVGNRPKRFIAVAGNMGAGKTELVSFLCRRYKLKPFFEPNEANPYLDDFYADMSRWAFHSQVYFLAHKFRLHRELEREHTTVLQDRTIYEDAEIFAENLYRQKKMSERDYRTYRELYEITAAALAPPDLMIYLRCPVSTLARRIKLRGRPNEQAVPRSYLAQLNKLYEQWFERYDRSPVVILPTDKLDYITDVEDQIELLRKVEAYVS